MCRGNPVLWRNPAGHGGLVRAYSGAVKEGMKDCVIVEKKLAVRLEITTDYNGWERFSTLRPRAGSTPWIPSIRIRPYLPSWFPWQRREDSRPRL